MEFIAILVCIAKENLGEYNCYLCKASVVEMDSKIKRRNEKNGKNGQKCFCMCL